MTRGNQREKAREKNQKKLDSQKKKQEGDPKKRMEAQAEIMRQKQKEGGYFIERKIQLECWSRELRFCRC